VSIFINIAFKKEKIKVKNMPDETKIVYYIGDEPTPYMKKINLPPNVITLADFKSAVSKPNYKYFFKAQDQDFG